MDLITLPKSFYTRDTIEVAKEILGKLLVRQIEDKVYTAAILEVEAYLSSGDEAAHNPEVAPIGSAYIFNVRKYFCLNVTTEKETNPGCILIRAIDTEGCDGPGKLCEKLQINKSFNGIDMTNAASELRICDNSQKVEFKIKVSPRIGIKKGVENMLNFKLQV